VGERWPAPGAGGFFDAVAQMSKAERYRRANSRPQRC
jgi:hypothetical protein